MNKLWLGRPVLLLAVLLSLFALAPLELVADINAYFHTTAASAGTIFLTQYKLNLARQNADYPGDFIMAANLVPVANYFCYGLKKINFIGIKTKDFKVIGKSPQLHLAATVILMFYFFYHNSRTTSEEEPFLSRKNWKKNIRYV